MFWLPLLFFPCLRNCHISKELLFEWMVTSVKPELRPPPSHRLIYILILFILPQPESFASLSCCYWKFAPSQQCLFTYYLLGVCHILQLLYTFIFFFQVFNWWLVSLRYILQYYLTSLTISGSFLQPLDTDCEFFFIYLKITDTFFFFFQITGCKDVEYTAAEMKIVDCNVYNLRASAIFTEEGTDVKEILDTKSVSITRDAVKFKTLYEDAYMKPNLPYTLKVSCYFWVKISLLEETVGL